MNIDAMKRAATLRLSLGTKLVSGIVLAILLILLAGTTALFQLQQLSRQTVNLAANAQASQYAHAIQVDLQKLHTALAEGIARQNVEWFHQPLAQPKGAIDTNVASLIHLLREQGNTAQADAIAALHRTLMSETTTMVDLAIAGDWNTSYLRLANQVEPTQAQLETQIQTIDQELQQDIAVTIETVQTTEDEVFRNLGLVTISSLLILGLMSRLLWRSLVMPMRNLTDTAMAVTHGNLAARAIGSNRRDELGVLASTFNAMAETLEARIAAEQQARAEAQRLKEVEVESRQNLEQTVAEYLAFTQQVAQGDLSQRLVVRQDGVLGQLGRGLNTMIESLHAITRQVQEANRAIATATAEILAATTQQVASAAEQSAAITQTSTTIEEVKAIALQTAEQAAQVAQDSQATLSVARQGTSAVEETVDGMSQIQERVQEIAQTIISLAEQTQAIGTIISTVNDLANQSNLLALNAALEAARAGEQGKSFAVVAQHVRGLAERSKAATAQVQDILGDIQKVTNSAVLVTEEGTKGVEAGGRLVQQAGQVIHRIALEVEGGAQANVQMAAAAQQQTAGMEQVRQAMSSIQQATTQALSSTRQAERAAQDLHILAQSLQSTIAAYKL